MKIEHIALYVKDLETARSFFVKYLGAKSNEGSENRFPLLFSVIWRWGTA